MKKLLRFIPIFLAVPAFAAGGLIDIVDWYDVIAEKVLGEHFMGHPAAYYAPMLSAIFVLLLIVLLGIKGGLYKLTPEKMTDEELLPPKKFGVRAFLEMCWNVISSTLESVVGEHWQRYLPLLGGTFVFIIVSDLSGLVPGFHPPTAAMNMTFGMAVIIFFSFVWVGLKEGGANFIKHLMGPILAMAPIFFVIETIGLFARPVSLSLRLFGNISGDHLVFQAFSTLLSSAPWIPIPALLLIFGTLVACLQAFIFMTLSAVYIRLSLDTADHH